MLTWIKAFPQWLIDHLSRFGYSITSDEVIRFKESAIESFETYQSENTMPVFTQWVADNDHNIAIQEKEHFTEWVSSLVVLHW